MTTLEESNKNILLEQLLELCSPVSHGVPSGLPDIDSSVLTTLAQRLKISYVKHEDGFLKFGPPLSALRPTCPICCELILEAQVGFCGHSICHACVLQLQNSDQCPLCQAATHWKRNFQLQAILEDPMFMFTEEIQLLKTRLDSMWTAARGFTILSNDFHIEETKIIFQLIRRHSYGEHDQLAERVRELGKAHHVEVTFMISEKNDHVALMYSKTHSVLVCCTNEYMFVFAADKRDFLTP